MDLYTVTDVLPAPAARWRPGDAYLAGGSWLYSEPQPAVRRLLDLQDFGWSPLTVDGSGLEIAATCTLATLAAWTPPVSWPAGRLARLCCDALLGSFKIWHTATVGGNICLALPAGPMTSFTAALDGVATLWGTDGAVRELPVAELVTGSRRTALTPGELLRSVRLPAAALESQVAMRQMSLTPLGRSAALVIGRVDGAELVITVTAATPRPVQVRVAAASPASVATDAVDAVEAAVTEWYDDVHGAPAWRAAMTRRLVADVAAELAPESTR